MSSIIIIAISLIVAFFIKGKVSNKIIAVVFFIIGMLCFEASSFWWRIGFSALILFACDTGEHPQRADRPYIVIALTLVAMCVVKLVATDLFNCYPSFIYTVFALVGAVVYVLNVNNK